MKKVKKPARVAPDRQSLSYRIREVIGARGLTAYALAKDAGVDAGVVHRFLSGERDIRLETADRLASALGLRLVESGRRGRPAGPAPPAPAESPPTPDP